PGTEAAGQRRHSSAPDRAALRYHRVVDVPEKRWADPAARAIDWNTPAIRADPGFPVLHVPRTVGRRARTTPSPSRRSRQLMSELPPETAPSGAVDPTDEAAVAAAVEAALAAVG